MHIRKPVLVAILFTAFAFLGALHSTRAVAQTARTATCVWHVPGAWKTIDSEKGAGLANDALQAWMTSQLAAGATGFVVVPMPGPTSNRSICAY
jgi:hypothetical protein